VAREERANVKACSKGSTFHATTFCETCSTRGSADDNSPCVEEPDEFESLMSGSEVAAGRAISRRP